MQSPHLREEPAPLFETSATNGDLIRLEELRGKAVLINFWATWCDPCVEEMSLLETIAAEHPRSLVILAINEGESLAEVNAFIERENLNLQVYLDPYEKIGKLYNIGGYPTSIFIDADGIVQAIYLGELDQKQMKNNLRLIGVK